jgi:prepilin-type N-terminal cleavage/methylation domain-containing protein/prepilin-type processing-associated H-X9-DG protein
MQSKHATRGIRPAFTLIELLVVISIISLLISMLLPALSGARRTGQRVACMANMKNIVQGSANYAQENDDAILGGPATSGSYMFNIRAGSPSHSQVATAFGPAVQRWDFMGILAAQWGLPAPVPSKNDPGGQTVVKRFNDLRGHPAFLCRSNNFLAPWFGGPNAKTGPMVSYNTVRYQLMIQASSGRDASSNNADPEFATDPEGTSWYGNGHPEAIVPKDWRPSVTRLGNASNKVFCADGARYSSVSIRPDYDLNPNATWGGSFSDTGAFTTFSRGWDRTYAPGNGSLPSRAFDARAYAYRHSTGTPLPGAAGNAYKINLAFHDGHVETQGDLQAANPHIWLPKDSQVTATNLLWNDAVAQFGITGPFNIGP